MVRQRLHQECEENVGNFRAKEKAKCFLINNLAFYLVPRAGVEPARIAPLVFETSASTDSAIWANTTLLICGCKGTNNF